MKVLITGGGGPVGAALCEKLISRENDVVVYDLKHGSTPAGALFVEGDVRDFDHLAEVAAGCEAGIHLAVLAGETRQEDMFSVNVSGAYGFLFAASKARFGRSIVVSSAPVHLAASGMDRQFPLLTSGGDDRLYDLTKALQEVMAHDFHAHGLNVLCLRFGHVVRGEEETDLERTTSLAEEHYCRGGWVALEDAVEACAAALTIAPAAKGLEILGIVGSRHGRDRFDVSGVEERLGIKLRYDFAAFE
jgi:nucleoside-diphosphate-sugar epimerase